MEKKPEVSYNDFMEFKNEFLRDTDPLLSFGTAFCQRFGIVNDQISGAVGVVAARLRIDEAVEWVF